MRALLPRLGLLAVVLATLVIAPRGAAAYPTGDQFDGKPLEEDSGGGIAFDGAPRWTGHTCAVCHTHAPGRIKLRLEADHAELFTSGWKPSQQYHLRVVLTDTWANDANRALGDKCGFTTMPYKACDQNGFALEMADARGKPVGTIVPLDGAACATPAAMVADPAVRVLEDKSAVTHSGTHMGVTAWDFCWTAPAAGTGVITAYLAGVDGNGGDGTMAFPTDTSGDDVAAGSVPLAELGADAPGQTGGCNTTGDASGLVGIAAVLALLGWRQRHARTARLALVVTLAAGSGCTHVRANQRETLAKRNMQFAPDPTEDELDLHMQQSREGSAGGYGSSGGGCGCN